LRDAVGEHARLPGARAGNDEKRPFGGKDRFSLRRIKVGEVLLGRRDGHPAMLAAP
jgi:hypothetical protein